MRTTLDLPEDLLAEAMALSEAKTKTEVIKLALRNLIEKEKARGLRHAFGRVDLGINLDTLRGR